MRSASPTASGRLTPTRSIRVSKAVTNYLARYQQEVNAARQGDIEIRPHQRFKTHNFTDDDVLHLLLVLKSTKIGEGMFGHVYQVQATPLLPKVLRALREEFIDVVEGHDPPSSGEIIVKIEHYDASFNSEMIFRRRTMLESVMHAYVAEKSKLITVPLYFSGTLAKAGVRVTVMGPAAGTTVGTRLDRGPLSFPEFEAVEQSLRSLALLGVVHADLHPENVFLARLPSGAYRATIIDFGFAFKMPLRIALAVAASLKRTGGDLSAAWDNTGLQTFVDAKILANGFAGYHANIQLLRYLQSHIGSNKKKQKR
jgi:hypothetical protein